MSFHTCTSCGASLQGRGAVHRKYVAGIRVAYGHGHYDTDGTFEPDVEVPLPDGAQTFDGYDECSVCRTVVG